MDLILRIPIVLNESLEAAAAMQPLKRGTVGSMLEQLRDPRAEG